MKNLSTIPRMKRMFKKLTMVVILLPGLLGLHSLASGQIIVPSGYKASFFATGLNQPVSIAVAPSSFGAFGGHLFIANNGVFNGSDDDFISRVSPDGTVFDFANVGTSDPLGISFGPGGGFGENLFVATNTTTPGVGDSKVFEIDPNGTVSTFSITCCSGSGGLDFDLTDAYGSDMFIGLTGPGDGIGRVSPTGFFSTFFVFPFPFPGFSGGANGIKFGPGGDFGTEMFVSVFSFSPALILPGVYKISPNGTVSTLANTSTSSLIGQPGGLAFAPGGIFGEDLYLTDVVNGTLLMITPQGKVSVFASGFSNPTGIVFSETETLYVVEQGSNRVIKITVAECTPPPSGLVSWWPGENNANDIQSSNHGTLQNGATFAAGKVGQAFSFDGIDDFVEIPNSASLNITNAISLDAWIYINQYTFIPAVISKGNGGNYFESYSLTVIDDGRLQFVLNRDGTSSGRTNVLGPVIPLNTWAQVAGTYDGTTMRIYLNGVEVGSATHTGGIFVTTHPVVIGKNDRDPNPYGYPTSFFDGLIDEASIYNRALTAQEIADIYNAGSAGNCKTCVPPTADAGADKAICPGQSIQIGGNPTGSGGTGTLTFSWMPTDGLSNATAANPTATPTSTTTYSVTVTDANGCSATDEVTVTIIPTATIEIRAAFHKVGAGTNPGSTKTPLYLGSCPAATCPQPVCGLKVFDKAIVGSPDPKDFEAIWNSSNGLISCPSVSISGPTVVPHGGGDVNLYTILVPSSDASNSGIASGSYLVIGVAGIGGDSVYVGSPTDPLATGSLTQKYFQVIQKSNGQIVVAKTTAVPGSLLLIAEPVTLEFTSAEELLPIIYESVDGDWSVNASTEPPEGFVSTPGTIPTNVSTSELEVAQFTIKDVGSKWTSTKVTHCIKHKGKNITVTSDIPMKNKQNKGLGKFTGELESIPTAYALHQNYPNPFNPTTEITFALPEAGEVKVSIYSETGQLVRTLASGKYAMGKYQITWDGRNESGQIAAAGVYLYRLVVTGENGKPVFSETRRMTLLK